MNEYDGPERRKDEHSIRIVLLEKQASDNKESLVSVHRRITQLDHEFKAEQRISTEAIMDKFEEHSNKEEVNNRLLANKVEATAKTLAEKMENQDKAKAVICSEHISHMAKLESTVSWLDRWVLSLSAGYITAVAWLFHLQDKR